MWYHLIAPKLSLKNLSALLWSSFESAGFSASICPLTEPRRPQKTGPRDNRYPLSMFCRLQNHTLRCPKTLYFRHFDPFGNYPPPRPPILTSFANNDLPASRLAFVITLACYSFPDSLDPSASLPLENETDSDGLCSSTNHTIITPPFKIMVSYGLRYGQLWRLQLRQPTALAPEDL